MREVNEFTVTDNRTVVPLAFAPYQSLFVVFRKTATRRSQLLRYSSSIPP